MITLKEPIHFSRPLIIAPLLQYQLIDDPAAQCVWCKFPFTSNSLLLWGGDAYAEIGNWTQEQAEARIIALLGDDPKQTVARLLTK